MVNDSRGMQPGSLLITDLEPEASKCTVFREILRSGNYLDTKFCLLVIETYGFLSLVGKHRSESY